MTTQRRADLRRMEAEVGALIRRVKRVMGVRAQLVHPDLQPASFVMLSRVVECGPIRATDLATEMAMDKGAVSRHVQQLVDLGLLERRDDPDDRRATLLVATADARERLTRMQQQRSDHFDDRLADWSDEEIAQLADLLGRYNVALEGVGAPA